MTAVVVDASVAASWLFDDEDDPRAEAALDTLEAAPGLAPPLWSWEMRTILLVARRRGRLDADGMRARVAALADLPLALDGDHDLDHALRLAEAHGLSFYDALYLELALRRGAALATLDGRLLAAARAEGVAVVPPDA